MTYIFGARSTERLATCSKALQRVARRALEISPWDFCIVWGHRGEERQDEAFFSGASKRRWPDSEHNKLPSEALDFAPWVNGDIPWEDTGLFYKVAAVFQVAAKMEGIVVRSGSDWDRDGLTRDQNFHDLGHVEELP